MAIPRGDFSEKNRPKEITPFLRLEDCEFAVKLAEQQDVSPWARGDPSIPDSKRVDEGFMVAYRKAGGDPSRLENYWLVKREGFVRRMVNGGASRGESPYEADGVTPTRRHLSLIMWAYTTDKYVPFETHS